MTKTEQLLFDLRIWKFEILKMFLIIKLFAVVKKLHRKKINYLREYCASIFSRLSNYRIAQSLHFQIFRFSNLQILFSIIGLCVSVTAFAQNAIQTRRFDSTQLRDWKNSRDFQYQKNPIPEIGLWERFKMWLARLWYEMMSTQAGINTFWTVVIILSVSIIIFFVWKYKGGTTGMWSKSDKGNIDLESLAEENIHEIDFEEKIAQAISAGKYRLAIRLRYLYLLKILDDKGIIKWRAGKTNHDYILEVRSVSSEETYALFRQMSTAFDFAWYGEHNATVDDYENVKTIFDKLNNHSFTTSKTTENERI